MQMGQYPSVTITEVLLRNFTRSGAHQLAKPVALHDALRPATSPQETEPRPTKGSSIVLRMDETCHIMKTNQ